MTNETLQKEHYAMNHGTISIHIKIKNLIGTLGGKIKSQEKVVSGIKEMLKNILLDLKILFLMV